MGLLSSVLISFACALFFAAGIYWLDRYEKEPRILLGVIFTWGSVFAAGVAYAANTLLTEGLYTVSGSAVYANLISTRLLAPVLEESLKGLAVLGVFIFFYDEFDSLVDGIVYASVVALGFAATENAFYLYTRGFVLNGWPGLLSLTVTRIVLVGWQHPFYTAFIGIGLAVARLSSRRSLRFGAVLLGWIGSVAMHMLHNSISGLLLALGGLTLSTLFDWSGWLLMFVFVLWALSEEGSIVRAQLREEVSLGIISLAQYHTACSTWRRDTARLTARAVGTFALTDRFYQVCSEIALKKQEFVTLDEHHGEALIIEQLRTELARLAPSAMV